jgi:hypothetical protein
VLQSISLCPTVRLMNTILFIIVIQKEINTFRLLKLWEKSFSIMIPTKKFLRMGLELEFHHKLRHLIALLSTVTFSNLNATVLITLFNVIRMLLTMLICTAQQISQKLSVQSMTELSVANLQHTINNTIF